MATKLSFGLTIGCAFLLTSPAFGQMPDAEEKPLTVEEEALVAFVQLGNFSDRGIVGNYVRHVWHWDVDADPNEAKIAVPRELLELLGVREKNLVQDPPTLPWLLDVENQIPPKAVVEKHTPQEAIDRFRKYGIIELFHNENTKLLDEPLTQRKGLIDRIKKIEDQFSVSLGPFYAGKEGPTEARLIFVAGHLRTLSVELDMEILKSLSPAERVRVGKLASYLLPGAIAEAKRWNRKYTLGSAVLDSFPQPNPAKRNEK